MSLGCDHAVLLSNEN